MSRLLLPSTASLLAIVAAAPAQSFTLSAPVATALTLHVPSGTTSTQVPAGPLAPSSYVSLQNGGSLASFSWSAGCLSTYAVCSASARCLLPAGGNAAVAPGELLYTLTVPPGLVYFEMEITIAGTAGAPIPHVRIDLGADGLVEVTEASPPGPQILGLPVSGPFAIRIAVDAALVGTGMVDASARVTARPGSGVFSSMILGGCGAHFDVVPTWGGDIVYGSPFPSPFPKVAVLGLQVQPLLMPAQVGFPCLLLPSPDLLVLLSASTAQSLAIPAAVRPITIWAQAVEVDPLGLLTSGAYQVFAN
jgi:hypothetical protein